jgi:hypothetical protein
MRGIKALVSAAALAVTTLVATPAASAAAYQAPVVQWAHNVHVSGDTATVQAKYKCYGGNVGTHLWVSLKQGDRISALTIDELVNMEGTSAIADAWYDSHPGEDPGTVGITCNGQWQVQTFTVHAEFGTLNAHEKAFLQFCLFDNTATDSNFPQGFAYAYRFVTPLP